MLVTATMGCFGPIKVYDSDTGSSCPADDSYSWEATQSQDPVDKCYYDGALTTAAAGTSEITTATAPSDYATGSDTFSNSINSDAKCLEAGETEYSKWLGENVATSYVSDYNTTSCSYSCTAANMTEMVVNTHITICDENDDLPGAAAASGSAGPPPPADDDPMSGSRSGRAFSGIYWYQVLNRTGGYTCTLVRYKATGNSHVYSGVVLSTESTQGGTTTHTLVDQEFLPRIGGASASATLVEDGDDIIVSMTLGNQTLDDYYDLTDEEVTFSPSSIGPQFGPVDRWTMVEVCANLRARQ